MMKNALTHLMLSPALILGVALLGLVTSANAAKPPLVPLIAPSIPAVKFEGVWRLENHMRAKTNVFDHMPFSVTAAGTNYLIVFDILLDKKKVNLQVGSDGRDVYEIESPLGSEGTNSTAYGLVLEGAWPTNHTCSQVLWLGLVYPNLPQEERKNLTNQPLRLQTLSDEKEFWPGDCKFEWKVDSETPFVHLIDVYAPGSGTNRENGTFFYLRPPYDQGYLRAKYLTISSGVTNDAWVSWKFQYDRYLTADEPKSKTDVRLYQRWVATVTNVVKTELSLNEVRPAALGRTLVNDHRFQREDKSPGGYVIQRGDRPLIRNGTTFSSLQSDLKREDRSKQRSKYLLVPLFVAFAGPLVWLLLRKKPNMETKYK